MRRRFDLTDFEWSLIEPLLPQKSRGVARVDDRRVINAIPKPGRSRRRLAKILAKANRKRSFPFSTFLYRYRNLVERFFENSITREA